MKKSNVTRKGFTRELYINGRETSEKKKTTKQTRKQKKNNKKT